MSTISEEVTRSSPVAARVDRYVVLDGLRGVAALAIVVHHLTACLGSRELFASASIAVDFFFCLSGFVIAHAYYGRIAGGLPVFLFARRRLARLFPMYFMGTLMGFFAMAMYVHAGRTSLSYADLGIATVLNAFYVPYLNSHWIDVLALRMEGVIFPLNNPAWSLLFGIIANFTFAATLRISRHLPLIVMGLSSVGLCIATVVLGEAPGWGTANILGGFPRVFFSFFAGIVIFQYHDKTAGLPRMKGILIILLVSIVVAVPRFAGHRYYWLGMVVLVMPVIVAMGSQCFVERDSLMQKAFAYAGQLSYTVFCVHYPLLMFFSFLDFLPMEVFVLIFLASTVALSHVLALHAEKPMREWLSRRLMAR